MIFNYFCGKDLLKRENFLQKLSLNGEMNVIKLNLLIFPGGALMGNLLFGFLIDMNCIVPIFIFSAMLFCK